MDILELYRKANRQYEKQNFNEAQLLYQKCLVTQNQDSDCLNNLANTCCQSYLLSIHEYLQGVNKTHQKIGEYKKAFKLYERAIELDPNHFYARFNLGVLLMDKANNKKALEHLTIAATLYPEDATTRYHLAECKEAMIDDEEAIEDYTLAFQLDPSKPNPLLARGSLHEALCHRELARADFDRAVNMFPEMYEPYLERGKMKLEDENLEGSLIDFSKGLSINSESWPLYSHRSRVFGQLAERLGLEEFSLLAKEDKLYSDYYFDTKDSDVLSDKEFVGDLRLRQCE